MCLIPPDKPAEEKGRIEGREGGKKRGTKEGRRGWSFDQTDRQRYRGPTLSPYTGFQSNYVLVKTVVVEDMEVLRFEFITDIGPLITNAAR